MRNAWFWRVWASKKRPENDPETIQKQQRKQTRIKHLKSAIWAPFGPLKTIPTPSKNVTEKTSEKRT